MDLADSAAMLTRREASTPRPSPRCTCLPPRQHCAEVALGASTTDSAAMLTQREASTPRPSPRCTCLPPRQHCVEVALRGKQVHLGFASEYLLSSSCNFIQLKSPSAIASKSAKFTSPHCRTYTKVHLGFSHLKVEP